MLLPAPGLAGENTELSVSICLHSLEDVSSPLRGHALTPTDTFLAAFPTSSSGIFSHLTVWGDEVMRFLDFLSGDFPLSSGLFGLV